MQLKARRLILALGSQGTLYKFSHGLPDYPINRYTVHILMGG
jgi:hypothetical protein